MCIIFKELPMCSLPIFNSEVFQNIIGSRVSLQLTFYSLFHFPFNRICGKSQLFLYKVSKTVLSEVQMCKLESCFFAVLDSGGTQIADKGSLWESRHRVFFSGSEVNCRLNFPLLVLEDC